MSIGSIVGGGVRLVRTQPRLMATWAALYLATMLIGMVAMGPWMSGMVVFQQQAAQNAALGIETPPIFPAAWFGQLFLLEFVFLILLVVAFAAVVRAVVRPGGDRFAYLRLGMDELRLIGLGVLLVLAGFGVEIVAIVVAALIGGAATLVLGQGAAIFVAVVVTVALLAAAIWLQVRLSLAGAMTVIRGRIVIRDAWRATRGRFWTLLGAYLLLTLSFSVVTIVLVAVTNPQAVVAYASLDSQGIAAAAQAQMAWQGAGLSTGLIVQAVLGAIVGVVMGAVTCGAVATAAIELGGEGPQSDAFDDEVAPAA